MNQSMNENKYEVLYELIKDIDIAMLTTHTEEGLVSRPMKTQDVEFDGDLWFFSKKDTSKYHEILHDSDVNVAYVGKSYVSIRGKAQIVEDIKKKKELWNKMNEKIMQTTYDDPTIILIKVDVQAAEYWEQENMLERMAYYFKRMTGKEMKKDDGNVTLDFEQ